MPRGSGVRYCAACFRCANSLCFRQSAGWLDDHHILPINASLMMILSTEENVQVFFVFHRTK